MRCAGVAATYGTHGLTSEVATGWLVAHLFFGGVGGETSEEVFCWEKNQDIFLTCIFWFGTTVNSLERGES